MEATSDNAQMSGIVSMLWGVCVCGGDALGSETREESQKEREREIERERERRGEARHRSQDCMVLAAQSGLSPLKQSSFLTRELTPLVVYSLAAECSPDRLT